MFQHLKHKWFTTRERITTFVELHGKHLPIVAFISGFIWDNLTLTRVGLLFDNIVIFSYLLISISSIVLINLSEGGLLKGERSTRLVAWLPFAMQFSFGNLFSGYLVYYSRSGSLGKGWIFVAILALLLIGNEFFKKRYQQLTFQLSVFFVTLYTFTIFYLPIIVASIDTWVFVLSGIISLLAITLLMVGLSKLLPVRLKESRRSLAASIIGIYLVFNLLYFTNLIPPLPLGLKEIGVFHHVERTTNDSYIVKFEPAPWYQFFSRESKKYHYSAGEGAYCFSAVFAPTRLNTQIRHRWQMYDEQSGKWVTKSIIGYTISGGRDGGYRGYTIKQNIPEGRWRCDVITRRGALIGRVKFYAYPTGVPVDLESDTI